MDTLETLRARHAAEIAALSKAQSVALACPFPPRWVSSENSSAPWVSYVVKTLEEACNVMRGFTVLPAGRYRSSGTVLLPGSVFSTADLAKYGDPVSSPWACWIEVTQGGGYGPLAKLIFFAQIETGPVRVSVQFGTGYIGSCLALAVSWVTIKDSRDRTISRVASPNLNLYSTSDELISWGSGDVGPVKTSATLSYLFCADQAHPLSGALQSHALAQLANLANLTGV